MLVCYGGCEYWFQVAECRCHCGFSVTSVHLLLSRNNEFLCIFICSECLDQEENIISPGQMKRENMKLQKELAQLCSGLCW